jgi:MYXO-CTERM domain-containing protein
VEIADAGSEEEDASASAPDAGVADAGRPTPPRPPRGDASVPPSTQDAGASGGNTPPGSDSGNAPPPADEPDVSKVDDEGCGCTTSGAKNGTAVFGGLFVLVSLLGLGRRRRS